MKKIFALALTSLLSLSSFGLAELKSARLDDTQKNILIDVTYGGCGTEDYYLKVDSCLETFPVQCIVKFIDNSGDTCKGIFDKTISISLAQAQLDKPYYSNAALTIVGETGKVFLVLPSFSNETSSSCTY